MRMRTRPQAAIENESAHYSLGSLLISWDITHSVNGEALNACDIKGTRETVSNDIMERWNPEQISPSSELKCFKHVLKYTRH